MSPLPPSRDWALVDPPADLAARYRAEGLWTDDTLGQLLDGRLREEADLAFRVWSATRPVETTMGEVHQRARRFAASLRARGVGPGDVVAFWLPNCVEAAVVFWGAALLGAVVVPIVHFYGPKEVGYILAEAQPRAVVTADRFGHVELLAGLTEVRAGDPALELVAVVDLAGEVATQTADTVAFDDLTAPSVGPLVDAVPVDPAAPALIAYTSGTTADPKGVVHTHRSIVAEVRQLGDIQPPQPRPTLTGAPVGHAIGMLTGLLLPVYRRQAVHLIDVWDPARILDAMVDADLTAGSGATYFLTSLLDAPAFGPEHLERMRWVGLGGSAVPEAVADRAIGLGISVARSYGSTEHPSTTGAPHDLPQDRRRRTDGRPLPGVELRIVDATGADLPAGEPGEILSRGPDLFAGYTDPTLTATAIDADGWYHTGDVGVLDEQGWLTITDRLKDVIIRGGENISAAEVEDLVLRMPGVAEVAVVAAPDERLGEHGCAFVRVVEPSSAPTLADVQAHLGAAGLARQKWPEELRIVADLPRTPSGKVRKHELRARLRDEDRR
ncbi:MAG: AMP-binding protein [Acidimicrobiales bacterium]